MKTKQHQPKTGAKCSCKPGQQRDNCPTCEGTGQVVDFAAIRARRTVRAYTIDEAIQEVAAALDGGQDRSQTTIRCALNDALDAASKSGFEVADDETGFGYEQPEAVQAVREIIGKGI